MRTVYIFIKCKLGAAYTVAAQIIDEIEETSSVHSISGEFDLIAQFRLESDADIGRFVNEKLHAVPGLVDTQTIICFNAFTKDKGLVEGG